MSLSKRYQSLLHRPPPRSTRHKPMSPANRAAQFAPFAALVGYDAAVDEAGRLTQPRLPISEEEQTRLNLRLSLLQAHAARHPEVTLTVFQPDARKEGGTYVTLHGMLRQVDTVRGVLVLRDWQEIPLENLYAVDAPILRTLLQDTEQ